MCEALEDWQALPSFGNEVQVRFESGEAREAQVSNLVPEDRWRLHKHSTRTLYEYFGCPTQNGSPLAVTTVIRGGLTLCSTDELRVVAQGSTEKYKKGKASLHFLVVGSYIAKKNLVGPTWHVRLYSFDFVASRRPLDTSFVGLGKMPGFERGAACRSHFHLCDMQRKHVFIIYGPVRAQESF